MELNWDTRWKFATWGYEFVQIPNSEGEKQKKLQEILHENQEDKKGSRNAALAWELI